MSTEFINDQWRLPNAWNGSESNVNKQSNYSMDFDSASGDYIKSSLLNSLDGLSEMSVSLWIKPSGTSQVAIFLSNPNSLTGSGNFQFAIGLLGNELRFLEGTNSKFFRTTSAPLTYGQWNHVAISYTAPTALIYVNAVAQSTVQNGVPTTLSNADDGLHIGKDRNGFWNVFDGQIDAVAIFNYALTDGTGGTVNQIAALYGSSSTGIGNPMSLSPKPVASYNLGDQDAFNGSNYLVPNSSLKDYVFDFGTYTSNDRIIINNTFDTIITGTNFTISSWVNLDSVTSNQLKFIFTNESLQFVITDKITTYLRGASGYFLSPFNGNTTLTTGEWYNVVLVKSGSDYTYYLNGSPDGTVNNSTAVVNSSQTTSRIGMFFQNNTYAFDGLLSNVQIFNTALSGPEAETLYNNGSPIKTLANIPQNSNLQGWWKLDASDTYDGTNWTIEDHAGSNDGTSSGMTQANLVQSDLSFTSGYSPYALDFDAASSDYIDCATGLGDSLGTYTGDLTLSYWFNTNSLTANDGIFTIGNFNNTQGEFQVNIYSNNMLFRVDSGNQRKTLSISSLSTGTWYHIGFIYKAGDISGSKVYLNGVEQLTTDTGTFPSSLSFSGLKTIIGGYYGTGNTFDGKLSNVAIWNTALTSAQVSEIYNEGVPSNLNNHSAYSNLVSWWQLGSNSSFNSSLNQWTCIDEKGTNTGESSQTFAEDAIVDGVGSYANGLSSGMGGDEVIGDAPYSTANALSVNMDVEDRVTDTPS